MADVRTTRRWVPRAIVLLSGAGALLVGGYLASIHVREELAIIALRSPDLERRVAAARTLGSLGTVRAIPALLDCERPEGEGEDVSRVVYEREPEYAFAALDRLVRSAAVPRLLELARHEKPANRVWAVQGLGRTDSRNDEVFRALNEALADTEPEVVAAAAASLLRFGRTATPCLVDVLAHLDRWEPNSNVVGYPVSRLLARLGPLAWPAVKHAPRIARQEVMGNDVLSLLHYLDAGVWAIVGAELQQRIARAPPEEKAQLATELSGRRLDFADGLHQHDMAPALEALLDDESADVREAAVTILKWCTGKVSEKMLRVAVDVARDGTSAEAEYGAAVSFWAFCEIAPTSVEALRPLLQPLERVDPERYELTLYALADSAAHYPAALALLQERGVNAGAVAKPSESAELEKTLPTLLDDVRSEKVARHRDGIKLLRWYEPTAKDIPLLERLLADPDTAVQAMAARLLARLGRAAGAARPALEAVVQKASLTVRVHAALALCQLGAPPGDLEIVFREACKEERLEELGVEGLVRLRIADEPALRWLLSDQAGDKLTAHAFTALVRMGADAAPAVPFLRELLRSKERALPAAEALGSIGPPAEAAVAELAAYIRQTTAYERRQGLAALVSISPTPATAALLAESLLDPDDDASKVATSGLLELAPHAAGTVPFLLTCLRRNHRALEASVILSRIGATAIPALLQMLDDTDADLRTWAAWTLGGMGATAAGAVEALELRLGDADQLARAAAAHAMGLIGKAAERSIPALEKLAGDASALVRRQTATALRRLRDPQAWRPGRRDVPPEDDFRCGNALLEEQERFHATVCEKHAAP